MSDPKPSKSGESTIKTTEIASATPATVSSTSTTDETTTITTTTTGIGHSLNTAASPSNQWTPPSIGNPDLDPFCGAGNRPNLSPNIGPFTPRGMLFDPRDLLNQTGPGRESAPDARLPPGARFDPFGPPDPSEVGPGRGPKNLGFKPNPDHFPPPGPKGPGPGFF